MKFNIASYLLLFCIVSCKPKIDDTLAIKQLLEKESATWRSGDIKAHADCWQIQPYSRILVSTADGKMIDVPPTMMINPPATSVGKGGSSARSNYKMSIHGDNAWVSHDEISIAKDGTKNFTAEIRMLEKMDGQWKLVGQSIHVYKPQ
jgi:hypothetical protein